MPGSGIIPAIGSSSALPFLAPFDAAHDSLYTAGHIGQV